MNRRNFLVKGSLALAGLFIGGNTIRHSLESLVREQNESRFLNAINQWSATKQKVRKKEIYENKKKNLSERERAYIDMVGDAFPIAFETAKKVAIDEGVNPLFLYALMYVEGGLGVHYNQGDKEKGKPIITKRSSTGDRGLLGLMPNGAFASVGPKLGYKIEEMEEYEPNLRVGTAYLRKMFEKFYGNLPLAMLAYNWGPGNVDELGEKYKLFNGKGKKSSDSDLIEYKRFQEKLKNTYGDGKGWRKNYKEPYEYVGRVFGIMHDFGEALKKAGIEEGDYLSEPIITKGKNPRTLKHYQSKIKLPQYDNARLYALR